MRPSRAGAPRSSRGLILVAGALLLVASPARGQEPAEPEILGAPSAWGEVDAAEARVTVAAGTSLRESPDRRAGALAIVDADVELPELERRGDWVRVRYGGFKGWVWLGDEPPGAPDSGWDLLFHPSTMPSGGAPLPPPETGRGPDRGLVERARELLGDDAVERDLGPWTLLTDVEEGALVDSLGRLAAEVVEAYRERYGLAPALPAETDPAVAKEVVILFDDEAGFRSFAGPGTPVGALDAAGQAGFGVAAMARGDRTAEAVRTLFVHELVHLLNRRSFGTRTAGWLEEGLADGLAISRINPSGALDPKALGGTIRTTERFRTSSGEPQLSVEITGGLSLLELVKTAAAAGTLPSLEELTSESWRNLADPEVRTLRYAQSALLVRYLLDGDRRRWRPGFQRYLQGVVAGEPAGGERLLEDLGVDGWGPLESGFDGYLRFLELTH